MILDYLLELANGLAVTDTDAYTTYSYDLGNTTVKRRIGAGEPLALRFTVDTAAAGSTDTTDFFVVTSTAEGLATSTKKVNAARIANASLTAGSQWDLLIPNNIDQRYIGGKVELGSGDTITVSCNIVPANKGVQNYTAYSDGVTWEA